MLRLTKKLLGEQSEAMAQKYLEKQGLIYVTRNFLCRRGEIDLIMKDEDQLVFVEVRYRSRDNHGTAVETITRKKQKRIILAAQYYLHKNQLTEKVSCRFDVVAASNSMKTCRNGACPDVSSAQGSEIRWLKNAFDTDCIATI